MLSMHCALFNASMLHMLNNAGANTANRLKCLKMLIASEMLNGSCSLS